jgi:hypothetical protein
MDSEITKDIEIRSSSVQLWTAILAGPFAFAVDLQLRFALVQWACMNHSSWVLIAIAGALVIIPIGAAIVCWRFSPAPEEDRVGGRVYFMAVGGFILNCAFTVAIIANAIPSFFLRACD